MWYQQHFKRNLIDMHIVDWDERFLSHFDPEAYADAVAASGVDTVIIYAGNCQGMCFWPSARGHMHQNLHGRDIFGETVAACRARGLKIVGYYNIWNRYEFDHHPEWRMRDISGRAARVEHGERFGLCCPSTGYRDFVRDQIDDLCAHYTFDGLWVDMIGWFGNICYCDGCRAAYRAETGRDLPETVDFSDPEWVRFVRTRQRWQADFAKLITDTAKSAQPHISVTQQCTSFGLGWSGGASLDFFSHSDYLAGDFYLGPWQEAFVCKLLRAMSPHHPVEFMVSACVDLNEHTTRKSLEMLSMQAMMAVSHQSAFVFIDAIDPVGTVNRPLYDRMRPILDKMTPYLPSMQGRWTQRADVGVYFNVDNLADGAVSPAHSDGYRFKQMEYAHNVSKCLLADNIAFDVVTPRQLADLSDYKVIVLSDCYMLDAAETAALRAFVEQGGALYVSGEAGFVDGEGNALADFALADVLGVHRCGVSRWPLTYMSPTEEGTALFDDYRADYPLCIRGAQVRVTADADTQVLATRAETCDDPAELRRFSSAISNPPTEFTDEPCLTVHPFGKGRAMYAAGVIESSPYDAQQTVFTNLIASLIDKPCVHTDAPVPVQVNVFDSEAGDVTLVNLLNFQLQLPAVPVHGITVRIDAGGRRVRAVTCTESGTPCDFDEKDGAVECRVDYLSDFAQLRVEWEKA